VPYSNGLSFDYYFVKVTLKWIIILSSILELVVFVDSFPTGAPMEACTDITPQHGNNTPSTDPVPFSVDLSDFTVNTLVCYIGGYNYSSKRGWV